MEIENKTLENILDKYKSLKEEYVLKIKKYFNIDESIEQKNIVNYLKEKFVNSENTNYRKNILDVERTLDSLNNLENLLNYNESKIRKEYGGAGFLLGGFASIPWGLYLALPNLPKDTYNYSGRALGLLGFPYMIGPWLVCGAIGIAIGIKLANNKTKKHLQKAEKTVDEIENIMKQYQIKSNQEIEEIERKVRNVYDDFIFSRKKKKE
ncbi:MAG: hypothetical protein QXR30_00890 [Candidatus Woesearchaeota archaeon]